MLFFSCSQSIRSGGILDEGREVAPVLRVYALHVVLEVVAAHLHIPLEPRLIAESLGPRGGGLHAERLSSWGDTKSALYKSCVLKK